MLVRLKTFIANNLLVKPGQTATTVHQTVCSESELRTWLETVRTSTIWFVSLMKQQTSPIALRTLSSWHLALAEQCATCRRRMMLSVVKAVPLRVRNFGLSAISGTVRCDRPDNPMPKSLRIKMLVNILLFYYFIFVYLSFESFSGPLNWPSVYCLWVGWNLICLNTFLLPIGSSGERLSHNWANLRFLQIAFHRLWQIMAGWVFSEKNLLQFDQAIIHRRRRVSYGRSSVK